MDRIVRHAWRAVGPGIERADILQAAATPEGFDVHRLRAAEAAQVDLRADTGQTVSVLRGSGVLHLEDEAEPLRFDAGSHLYLPPAFDARVVAAPEVELLRVVAEDPAQTGATERILRHEVFLAACAADGSALRWVLTPQYLSRRVFLHHDAVLTSRTGAPVSLFRTTMFDVSGLPPNDDGESVFRMSYDSRTEWNVCYDVTGRARVRMAYHPYVDEGQAWSAWLPLDGEATYHLDEVLDADGQPRRHRNRHEVAIEGGHCSLVCLFDPAPTGIEQHRPGAYSDYEPYAVVSARPEHAAFTARIGAFDGMVEALSAARARGALDGMRQTEAWARFEAGRAEAIRLERALLDGLGAGPRADVVRAWTLPADPLAAPR